MHMRWTLTIEDFAMVEKAEIEIGPFMLFVGDNHSGKSDVMSLLWGVMSEAGMLFDRPDTSLDSYQKCKEWLLHNFSENPITIDHTAEQLLIGWFNDLLDQRKQALLRRLFTFPMGIGKVKITNYRRPTPLTISFERDRSAAYRGSDENRIVGLSVYQHRIEFGLLSTTPPDSDRFVSSILQQTVWVLLTAHITTYTSVLMGKAAFDPLYLPASRAGLMLTYNTFVENLLGEKESVKPFPLSTVRFLQQVANLSLRKDDRYREVISLLEKEVLFGRLEADTSGISTYTYTPVGSDNPLPIDATCSLVAALSPLLICLESDIKFRLLIMEEPETHLQPELQRILTKALIHLVNEGLPVWLTTHSDTIVSQVNNLITLYNVMQKEHSTAVLKELGYSYNDTIWAEKVRVYQFQQRANGKTVTKKLGYTLEGFAVPPMNKAISNVTQEALTLRNRLNNDGTGHPPLH